VKLWKLVLMEVEIYPYWSVTVGLVG